MIVVDDLDDLYYDLYYFFGY